MSQADMDFEGLQSQLDLLIQDEQHQTGPDEAGCSP